MRFLLPLLAVLLTVPLVADVWTYDLPGGELYSSPDYEVSVTSDGITRSSFVHYSHGLKEYTRYSYSPDLEPSRQISYKERSWTIPTRIGFSKSKPTRSTAFTSLPKMPACDFRMPA